MTTLLSSLFLSIRRAPIHWLHWVSWLDINSLRSYSRDTASKPEMLCTCISSSPATSVCTHTDSRASPFTQVRSRERLELYRMIQIFPFSLEKTSMKKCHFFKGWFLVVPRNKYFFILIFSFILSKTYDAQCKNRIYVTLLSEQNQCISWEEQYR